MLRALEHRRPNLDLRVGEDFSEIVAGRPGGWRAISLEHGGPASPGPVRIDQSSGCRACRVVYLQSPACVPPTERTYDSVEQLGLGCSSRSRTA